jgi:hypothetical protein
MNLVSIIFKFLIGHLALIHQGSFLLKLKSSLSIAIAFSPFVYAIDNAIHWTVQNQDYVSFVFIAIMIDHILGSLIHLFVKRDFTFKKNIIGLLTKVGLVVAMGFLFEGINTIVKEDSFAKNYLIIVLRLTVFLYPAGSAFMNSAVITKGKFPPMGLINKIKSFQTDLDITKLREKQNDTNN